MNVKPLDDLEMFELLQAIYPGTFKDDSNETWDAVMEFVDGLNGFDDIAQLLGQVAMLTIPTMSALTNTPYHCLGKVEIKDGSAHMTAAVRRTISGE